MPHYDVKNIDSCATFHIKSCCRNMSALKCHRSEIGCLFEGCQTRRRCMCVSAELQDSHKTPPQLIFPTVFPEGRQV